jgi:hypothetical protein
MRRIHARFPCLLAATGALLLAACATPRPATAPNATASPAAVQALPGYQYLLSEEAERDARRHLSTLAADSMEGREAASRGERRAGDFLAAELERLGVQPGGDLVGGRRSYFQTVPLQTTRLDPDRTRLVPEDGPAGALGDDWIAFPSGVPEVDLQDAAFVFAGYGLSAPGHDDYAGLDVAGKVVLVAPGHPAGLDSVATPQGTVPAGSFLPKYVAALQHGAAAVLVVASREGSLMEDWAPYRAAVLSTGMALEGGPAQTAPVPFLFLHPAYAARLLLALGAPATTLDDAEEGRPLSPFVAEQPIDLTLAVERGLTEGRNVVGVIPGDERPEEYVAFGAHYDHLGVVAGEVYNGADDDASGVTALLTAAEALAADGASGDAPDRSALFVFHTAEEKGLHGSEFFAANPDRSVVGDLDRVVAQINIDMVGREHPDSLYVVGAYRLSTAYGRTVDATNAALGEGGRPLFGFNRQYDDPDDPENIYERSDHYSYAKRGVPIVFFTDGMGANWGKGSHGDHYHRPSDDVRYIDFGKVLRTARLAYAIARTTADAPERPEVDQPVTSAP